MEFKDGWVDVDRYLPGWRKRRVQVYVLNLNYTTVINSENWGEGVISDGTRTGRITHWREALPERAELN